MGFNHFFSVQAINVVAYRGKTVRRSCPQLLWGLVNSGLGEPFGGGVSGARREPDAERLPAASRGDGFAKEMAVADRGAKVPRHPLGIGLWLRASVAGQRVGGKGAGDEVAALLDFVRRQVDKGWLVRHYKPLMIMAVRRVDRRTHSQR